METIQKTNFAVAFPNYRLYIFDRNYIEIAYKSGEKVVDVTLSSGSLSFTERRQYSPGGFIRFDLFGLLFPFFDLREESPFLNEPCKVINVKIQAGTDIHTGYFIASYGLNFEDTPKALRVYSRHEFRTSIISGRTPTAADREYFNKESKPTYYTTSSGLLARKPARLNFESGGEVRPLRLVWDDCSEGVCLRWLDIYGNVYFWVFKEGDTTERSTTAGESLEFIPGIRNISETNAQEFPRARQIVKETKIGAVKVSADEAEYLKTIAGAVIVERFKGPRVGAGMWAIPKMWEGVTILGNFTTKKRVFWEDYEFTMQREYNTINW